MKKIIHLLMFLAIASLSYAQWQADVRLTNNASSSRTSSNNARCIASSGDTVHIVWYDERDGNYEIYYKRSTNGGTNWTADTRLTNNSFNSETPSTVKTGLFVHVVWADDRDGNREIYYKRSTDGGITWGTDTRLTNNTFVSRYPSISVYGQTVHLTWEDDRDGNDEIYFKRSTNGGTNWTADTRLTNALFSSIQPSISASGLFVHIVWFDARDNNLEIYYKRSADGGSNWTADTRLTSEYHSSILPSVSASGSVVHVVWNDNRNSNEEIYYKRSTNDGLNWSSDTRMTTDTSMSNSPFITSWGTSVHFVWEDVRDGNPEVYYKRSTNSGTNWESDTRLTNNSFASYGHFLSISGTVMHLIWFDNRDGNYEIYYKRNPTGNIITGIENNTSEIPSSYSLRQNYPNPFNPKTKIRFDVPKVGDVKIVVYDVMGREVQTLVNESLKPGAYEVSFDGLILTSGVYFYKISTGDFIDTKRMILLK